MGEAAGRCKSGIMNASFLSTSSQEQGEEEDGAASSGYYPPVILKEPHQKLWKSEGVKIVNISVEGLSQATILCSTNSVTKSVSMKTKMDINCHESVSRSVGYIDSVGVNFQDLSYEEEQLKNDLAMSADWHQLSSVTAIQVHSRLDKVPGTAETGTSLEEEKIIGDDLDKEKWRLVVCSTSKHDLERVLAWAEYGLMNWLSEIYRAIQGLQFVMKLVLQVLAHENGWQLFIQREFLVLLPPQWIRLAVGCTHQNGSRQE
ncbi:hypothetical protein SELMODRAFT_431102 [Selaginella moellendorffii]|uniref:Uncharacterized protein n=1 Tax=Selaginella moellendorffii TaxID=88036 RepID=D8TBI9_SELML|nr:hypothetical protein SELMODRAFT_431102 [Selaginella moellendorffii]